MVGLGIGEYDPVDIGGLAVDIVVLLMTGIKGRASQIGDILGLVIVLTLLLGLITTAFGLIAVVIAGAYVFMKVRKGGRK